MPPRNYRQAFHLPLTLLIFFILFLLVLYFAVVPDPGESPLMPTGTSQSQRYHKVARQAEQKLRASVRKKKELLSKALDTLSTTHLPPRLKELRNKHEVVGERLGEIKAGKETVEEILHAVNNKHVVSDRPPLELDEIIEYLTNWIHTLHDTLGEHKMAEFEGIWKAYHDLTVKTLYVWDQEYLTRMMPRREDGSIFLSVATYRDENCPNTLIKAYEKAKNPEKLFIGLVQQNCHSNCRSGVLEGGGMEDVEPDIDCHKAFCDSSQGKYCDQVRLLDIDEPESLGPYAARYFASKMWYGEEWYMQTDAHMTWKQDWDEISVSMLKNAPSKKPVISHYPPSHMADLEAMADKPASRLCGPIFATSDLESQIIRLEGASNWDKTKLDIPRFAPFTAAGYFVAHSEFLRDIPFDPFLPWIFMGEEIIMSTRLWTAGYDIFSPSQAVVGHIYVRRHKPKFWESVHRAFRPGVHNPLQAFVLKRIKHQLGYPECATDMLEDRSILTAVEHYSMGTERELSTYLEIVGLNMTNKEVTITSWCETGKPPPGFEDLAHLYE